MDIDEVRKRNLWLLVHPGGYTDQGVKIFSEKTGKSEQRIRHLIGKTVETETVKPVGKRACRDFEKTLGLETFWFDVPHFEESSQPTPTQPSPTKTYQEKSITHDAYVVGEGGLASLMAVATPRTHKTLQRLDLLYQEGKLTEEDLELIDSITRRLTSD